MSWDDWVFGVATGGLYNVGKTAYKAGKAADQAGDALEEISDGAGSALAAVGSTITKLGKDMSAFIKELEELLSIERVTPRNEEDLWDDEVERLQKLRQREAELLDELNNLDASDNDESWMDSFWGAIFGGINYEELEIRTKLAVVRKAIHEILYEEPGVIPSGLHDFQLILERIHTMEQPRIEDILDSIDDNLDQSEDLLKEVKKLFVVRTWKQVAIAELPEATQNLITQLEASLQSYDSLIEKNRMVSTQLMDVMVEANPAQFRMAKFIGLQPSKGASLRKSTESTSGGPTSSASSAGRFTASGIDLDKLKIDPGTIQKLNLASQYLADGPSLTLKGKISALSMQPIGVKVATALNQNAVSAYHNNYQMVAGRLRYFQRAKLKVEKQIYRLRWVPVDEPGVIPKILEEVRQTLGLARTESLPRINTILDSVNGAVVETTGVLQNVKEISGSIQGFFEFIKRNGGLLKLGAFILGAVTVFLILMAGIVLFRMAFGV